MVRRSARETPVCEGAPWALPYGPALFSCGRGTVSGGGPMHGTASKIAMAALGLVALVGTSSGVALAADGGGREQRACYATKEFGNSRLVLDVTFHSRLPTT